MSHELLYSEIGSRVRSARGGTWTQDQLARRVGVTRSSIANLEAGRQRVSLHVLYDIATTLDVPITKLLPLQARHIHITVELPDGLPDSSREFILACIEKLNRAETGGPDAGADRGE